MKIEKVHVWKQFMMLCVFPHNLHRCHISSCTKLNWICAFMQLCVFVRLDNSEILRISAIVHFSAIVQFALCNCTCLKL